MGHGIAELFAVNGFDVALMDKFPDMLEKAKARIASSLARSVDRGRLTKEQVAPALSRIVYSLEIGDAVSGADLVLEAVPESLELKRSVLKEACARAPTGAILASNTSTIRITELAEGLPLPDRVVGMHFFNPPMVMKLVEVIPGGSTDPSVVGQVAEVCKKIGKTPIKVLKDSPGFIVDRINAVDMLFFCLVLDKGIATPPEVDAYARGQGLPMGIYELIDFAGLDVAQASLSYFSQSLSPEYGRGVTFGRMVQERQLGKKTGKGFYDWSTGKAQIPTAPPTDKISTMDVFALEINEAVKLIEEGVARPDDIELGVTLGLNRPFGPIAVAKDLSNSEVKSKLEELAARFDCKVFAPTRAIAEGRLRDAIEGRLMPELGDASPSAAWGPTKPGQEGAKGVGPVRLERMAGGVVKIVLNRPRLNTINGQVLDGLDEIATELWNDPEVRVAIVTGEGGVFSAGADLSQFFSNAVGFMEFTRKGARILRRLSEIPKLTIAVMKGYVLGGGLELALSCDLRVATEDVEIGFPEVTRGLVPAWSGSQRLPHLIGLSQASSMILTSEKMKGRRAFEIGLANRLVTSGDADEYAVQYGRELASTQAPIAVMLAKRLLNKGSEAPSDVGLEMEAMAAGILFGTEDLKEGISAFLGKRKAEFKGK
jgi:enoyl-CoA hydratase/3-hydroxyacyl-CoA dehydrogenase